MTKIMLVEDDKSLREIYGVRLLAEGYDIVSAGDGEEALAMAIKERPQLIVSDVMMPKISGFDMLDILRSTTETKEIKVIMMTALSSEEQRTRGESLGADRYLVKSQVGIEDVVRVVHEVLADQPGATPAAAPAAAPAPQAAPAPTAAPAAPTSAAPTPAAPAAAAPAPQPATMPTPMKPEAPQPAQQAQPLAPPSTAPKPPSQRARIIQPLNDPTQSPIDINQLLNNELAKETGEGTDVSAPVSADQEKALIDQQIANFTPPTVAPAPTSANEVAPTAASTAPTPVESTENVPGINISEDGSLTPETDETPASAAPTASPIPAAPTSSPATAAGTPPPSPPPVRPPSA